MEEITNGLTETLETSNKDVCAVVYVISEKEISLIRKYYKVQKLKCENWTTIIAPHPTLGHYCWYSPIHLMLISAFFTTLTQVSLGLSKRGWVPMPGQTPTGV